MENIINFHLHPVNTSKNYLDSFAGALIPLVYGACYIPELLARVRMHGKQLSRSFREDPKVWNELVKPMENLMDTSFSDKFPRSFVRDLKKRHRYAGGVMALNQLDQTSRKTFGDINNSLQDQSLVDRVFLTGIHFLKKALSFIVRLYLFFRLRRINKFIVLHILYRLKNKLQRRSK